MKKFSVYTYGSERHFKDDIAFGFDITTHVPRVGDSIWTSSGSKYNVERVIYRKDLPKKINYDVVHVILKRIRDKE